MTIFLGITVVIALVVLYVFLKHNTKKSKSPSVKQQQKNTSQSTKFHAVSLQSMVHACKAAKDMEDKRFLSNTAPRLPLAECDALECNCKYIHYQDRRTNEFRRSPYQNNFGDEGFGQLEEDKRKQKERRKN